MLSKKKGGGWGDQTTFSTQTQKLASYHIPKFTVILYSYLWIILPKGLCNKAKKEFMEHVQHVEGPLPPPPLRAGGCSGSQSVDGELPGRARDFRGSHLFSLSNQDGIWLFTLNIAYVYRGLVLRPPNQWYCNRVNAKVDARILPTST